MQEYEDEVRKKNIKVITGDGIVREDITESINVKIDVFYGDKISRRRRGRPPRTKD